MIDGGPGSVIALVCALGAALFGPGLAILGAARHPARGAERWALAVGISVALWPVALLWSSRAGVAWTAWGVRAAVLGGLAAVAVAAVLRWRRGERPTSRPGVVAVTLAFVLATAVVLRVVQAWDLVVPAWVDGLHHTVITHLVVDGGVIPDTLRPMVAVDRFYYHFGFHALAAVVSWLSGVAAAPAVLWTGQALGALCALTVFALARRLVRHEVAAVAAAAVPAAVFWFPSYYVSWARYTQLAGLVVLPVAWLLVADAMDERRSWRVGALAAVTAAGLALVHYRVFIFFVVGVAVLAANALVSRRERARRLGALAGVGLAGAALVSPWLAGNIAAGMRVREAASGRWFGGPSGVDEVPAWLFTTGLSPWCLELGARGVLVAAVLRRRQAWALVGTTVAAVAAVYPQWLGLATSWILPPFSLAISAFLPTALGVAFLADAWVDLSAGAGRPGRAAGAVAALTVLACGVGARGMWHVVNPETVIVTASDIPAAEWIATSTPPDARFLVSTDHWHLGTYRGLDGGYWLPVLADRATNIPPALYPYGDPADVREITATAVIAARGDALDDAELSALMARVGATYVYVGAAGEGASGKLSPERLRRHPDLVEVYVRDGVHVFRRAPRRGAVPAGGGE